MKNITIRDSGNKEVLEAYFLNHEGQPYNLENKTVTFMENKDGDKFVSDPNVQIVNATAGFVRYTLQSQVHSAPGIAWFEINDDSGLVDSTGNFNIRVENGLRATADNTTYISDLEKLKQQMEALIRQAGGELKIELQRAEQQFNQELQNVFYPDVTEVKIDHVNTGYMDGDQSGKIVNETEDTGIDPVHTDIISVSPGEEYYVSTQSYWNGRAVNFLKDGTFVKALPEHKDTQHKYVKITIPSNINGVVLNGTRNYLPRIFKVSSYTQIPDALNSFVPMMKAQNYDFELVTLTKKGAFGYWDKNWGGFIEVKADSSRAQVAYEPVKVNPFEVYRISGCSKWDARLWVVIDYEGKVVDYCSIEDSDNLTETIVIPRDGAYLEINELMLNTVTKLEKAISIKSNLPLSGKNWTAIGDSWTQIHSDKKQSYVDYVSQITGVSAKNAGAGGTGYVAGGPNNWNNQFYKHSVDANSNIVTIFGSFNDAYATNFKFGKKGDTGTDTLWGSMLATINHVYDANPDALIGVITPGPWGAINSFVTDKMSSLDAHDDSGINEMSINEWAEQYVSTLEEFAKAYSLPLLDLYHGSGLRPWNNNFINEYYHGMNDTDTTHPNPKAMQKYIAPRIASFIESFA